MNKTRNVMILVVALFALVALSTLPAQPPKAKSAEGSVRVEVPGAMIEFFESRGVDLSGVDPSEPLPPAMEAAIIELYEAEDNDGDRVHSGRVNGMATMAMQAAYREVERPVYLQFGPLYWGYWTDKEGMSESDL